MFFSGLDEQVLCQFRNVGIAFAQWRQFEWHHGEAIKKILTKTAIFNHGGQVAMSCRNNADVDVVRAGGSEPLDFSLLNQAQQLHLRLKRKLADFVKEERATVSQLNFAGLIGNRASKGSAHVSKELGLNQVFGNGAAIDCDK